MDVHPDPISIGIRQVLAGLRFPAQRWQVIAQAHYYGAGSGYSFALNRLPARTYLGTDDIASQLLAARVRSHRRVNVCRRSEELDAPRPRHGECHPG